MSDVQPVSIDFGALKSPDYVGDYVNAFKVGRELAGQTVQGNAALNAFAGGDLAGRTRAAIAGLSPAQRARGAQSAEILAALGAGLKGVPYPARRSVLDHLTPALAARGLDPAAIASFDPTDDNLDAQANQALSLRAMLAAGGQGPQSPFAPPVTAPGLAARGLAVSDGQGEAPPAILAPQAG